MDNQNVKNKTGYTIHRQKQKGQKLYKKRHKIRQKTILSAPNYTKFPFCIILSIIF